MCSIKRSFWVMQLNRASLHFFPHFGAKIRAFSLQEKEGRNIAIFGYLGLTVDTMSNLAL